MNDINTWAQGYFVRQIKNSKYTEKQIKEAEERESHLVRPGPTDNAICYCDDPDDAKWIANRLNLASDLERLTYDFVTGKTDSKELIDYVNSKLP